jgi:hypothetical protein
MSQCGRTVLAGGTNFLQLFDSSSLLPVGVPLQDPVTRVNWKSACLTHDSSQVIT